LCELLATPLAGEQAIIQTPASALFPSTIEPISEQPGDPAVGVDVDDLGRRVLGQARHEHDLAAYRHQGKSGKSGRELDDEAGAPGLVVGY